MKKGVRWFGNDELQHTDSIADPPLQQTGYSGFDGRFSAASPVLSIQPHFNSFDCQTLELILAVCLLYYEHGNNVRSVCSEQAS